MKQELAALDEFFDFITIGPGEEWHHNVKLTGVKGDLEIVQAADSLDRAVREMLLAVVRSRA